VGRSVLEWLAITTGFGVFLVSMGSVAMPELAFGCSSQAVVTKVLLAGVADKVAIHARTHGVPSEQDGLTAVFGDEEVPRDAWGNAFVYVVPGPDEKPFDLISYGADGRKGGTGENEDLKHSEID
jgi:type II secretory pathway pseudopilin PulG